MSEDLVDTIERRLKAFKILDFVLVCSGAPDQTAKKVAMMANTIEEMLK